MKKYFLIAVALLIMSAGVTKAQVTIGSTTDPQSFSILELISGGERAFRLPQMTTDQRDAMVSKPEFQAEKNGKAQGLQIFNTATKCVETWNGLKWIQTCPPEGPIQEQILLTIKTTNDSEIYYIPTSGYVSITYNHAYDWNVSVDGGAAVRKTRGTTTDHNGIALTIPKAGPHQIRITPYNSSEPGWGNAFGHAVSGGDANSTANKQKLISIDAPLTTKAFAPTNTFDATGMFAWMFYNCTNLTTPAKIVDTYKLPETVTRLSNFLANMHYGNSSLTSPIDLSGLEGWFSNNQKITQLSNFLGGTHSGNISDDTKINLTSPIDLSPLSGWFNGNTSIEQLANFLANTHNNNTSLTSPINLSPLSGWFNGNTSITDLSSFLYYTHCGNTFLTSPIDIRPLSGWFNENRSMTLLSSFLSMTHHNNTSLILKGQKIFPNWIKTLKKTDATEIKDVEQAFSRMFYLNSSQSGDTAEPEFEDSSDGKTKLSDLGNPSGRKYTYQNRTVITNLGIGANWK
ncbi:MAG: hypothetical protein LBS54_08830 [Dysgonamonadaceae bacterium]|jgi:hypothetical protein|nr:hypothetical protein [Dysgonamonadaceae bacterium]